MSKRNRTPQQEKQMPEQVDVMPVEADMPARPPEQSSKASEEQPKEATAAGPTAKEMAAAEEQNAARMQALIAQQQKAASEPVEEPTLIGAAAQGMDVLHAAIQARSNQPVPEYVPPPRTERQMTQLEAELAAGQKAQERAQAQQNLANEARARAAAEEKANEGFTTPVYRPNDSVPDPVTGGMGPITQK